MESVVQHLKIQFDWQINNIPSSQSVTFSKDAKVWVHKTWKPQIFGGVFQNFFLLLWLKTTFEHFPFSPIENALCFHPFNFQRWKPQLSFLSHHSTSTHLDAIFDKNISSKKYACFFFLWNRKTGEKNIYWSVIFVKIFLWIFFFVDSPFWRGW